MTNEHPITPPPELVEQLRRSPSTWLKQITIAYQAGADLELEACCEWLAYHAAWSFALRAARRPKPPSLAKRALHILGTHGDLSCAEHDAIRRALEALDD